MADPIGIVLAAVLKGKREIAKGYDTILPPKQDIHAGESPCLPQERALAVFLACWIPHADCVLTKVLVSLTQLFCENPAMKNLKGLKKVSANFTLPIIYPLLGYPLKRISNFSQELHPILGDFAR